MKGMSKMFLLAAATIILNGSCRVAVHEMETTSAGTISQTVQENWADSVDAYRQQVRQGDATAYLRLAHCYNKGLGVKHDFVDMLVMVAMANSYGVSNEWDKFVNEMPADDPERIQIKALQDLDNKLYDKAKQKAALLDSMGDPAAELILGAVAMKQNNQEEAIRLLRTSANNGNRLARIAIYSFETGKESLLAAAEDFPMLYCELARERFKSDCSPQDFKQAAYYYQKAYDALCLDPDGAQWLLRYYKYLAQKDSLTAAPTVIGSLELMLKKYEERQKSPAN